MSKARDILAKLRARQHAEDINNLLNPQPQEPEIATTYLSSRDWSRFKATFIEEYGDEKVQTYSGMTHSEFLKYIKSGYRENSEFDCTFSESDEDF